MGDVFASLGTGTNVPGLIQKSPFFLFIRLYFRVARLIS